MLNRSVSVRRAVGSAIAVVLLVAAVPQSALAQERNLWKRWATSVTLIDRELRAEIPLAILFSIPAMVVVTPFWLVNEGLAKLSEMGDDEDDE